MIRRAAAAAHRRHAAPGVPCRFGLASKPAVNAGSTAPRHRPPRHGRVLRVGRVAALSGAARPAGGGRRRSPPPAGGSDRSGNGRVRAGSRRWRATPAAAWRRPPPTRRARSACTRRMGLMKAAALAPDAVLLPTDFDAYRRYSRLFKAAVRAGRADHRGSRHRRDLHRPDRRAPCRRRALSARRRGRAARRAHGRRWMRTGQPPPTLTMRAIRCRTDRGGRRRGCLVDRPRRRQVDQGGGARGHRPVLFDRHRAQQAARQDRLRSRQARRPHHDSPARHRHAHLAVAAATDQRHRPQGGRQAGERLASSPSARLPGRIPRGWSRISARTTARGCTMPRMAATSARW